MAIAKDCRTVGPTLMTDGRGPSGFCQGMVISCHMPMLGRLQQGSACCACSQMLATVRILDLVTQKVGSARLHVSA